MTSKPKYHIFFLTNLKSMKTIIKIITLFIAITINSTLYSQIKEYNNYTFYKLPERAQLLKRVSISIELIDTNFVSNILGSGLLILKGDSIYCKYRVKIAQLYRLKTAQLWDVKLHLPLMFPSTFLPGK